MESNEFQTAVRWWQGVGAGRTAVWCPYCLEITLCPLGHHGVACRHGEMVLKHNHLRDVIVGLCQRAHLNVSMENGHGLTSDHSRPKPAEVLIAGGKPYNY